MFSNNINLEYFSGTGMKLDARISSMLLSSIFQKESPMHDGAVIIKNNLIYAAKCVLPVSDNPQLPHHLGLRHRAALGASEELDVIVVVVSEETGNLSCAANGKIEENLSIDLLIKKLEEFIESEQK